MEFSPLDFVKFAHVVEKSDPVLIKGKNGSSMRQLNLAVIRPGSGIITRVNKSRRAVIFRVMLSTSLIVRLRPRWLTRVHGWVS